MILLPKFLQRTESDQCSFLLHANELVFKNYLLEYVTGQL